MGVPRLNKCLEEIEVKKKDGSLEKNLKFTCPVCGRVWYSIGEIARKAYHQVSQIYSPPKCPCYSIQGGKKKVEEQNASAGKIITK